MTSEPADSREPVPADGAGPDRIAREQCSAGVRGHGEAVAPLAVHAQIAVSGAESVRFRTGPDPSGARPARDAAECGEPRGAAAPGSGGPAASIRRLWGRQEIAFAIVGIANTAMGIGLTVAWLALLGDSVPPSVGVVAAYVSGIGIAFFLHRRLVFRVHGRIVRDFVGFAVVNCGGLAANALLLEVAVSLLGCPRALSAVVVMGAVAAGTFFGHRYISFRRPAV